MYLVALVFVMADIPGIIEGARSVGLGLDLRHIERTRLLIHVVDISGIGRDPVDDFIKINEELKKYSVKLWMNSIVAANKCDMLYDESLFENFKAKLNEMGYTQIFKISAASREGVDELMKATAEALSKIPVTELEIKDEDRFVPEEKNFTYTIRQEEEGIFVIEGSFVDRLLLAVNVNDPDSLKYFHKVLKNKGIIDELLEMGIQDGDLVRLNDFEFEFLL